MTENANPAVIAAFSAGWSLAELYDNVPTFLPDGAPAPNAIASLPEYLPGVSKMTGPNQAAVLVGHVTVALTALTAQLDATAPSTTNVSAQIASAQPSAIAVRTATLALYEQIQEQLAVHDPIANTAFGLGRMLADTALLPHADGPEVFGRVLAAHRIANATSWLRDLDAAFPTGAASAVRHSLTAWTGWVDSTRGADGTVAPALITAQSVRSLRSQGRIWQRLLTGQMNPAGLLNAESYVEAANSMLHRSLAIAKHFMRAWWPALAAILAVLVTGVIIALVVPTATARTTTIIATVLATFGLSWKTIGSTLGSTLSQAESELWKAEVSSATGRAATVLPPAGPTTSPRKQV